MIRKSRPRPLTDKSEGNERRCPAFVLTVLATVNVPHREKLDAQCLAHCLLDPAAAKTKPGHVLAFFSEVSPRLQVAFAAEVGIPEKQLKAAARDFAKYSGSRITPSQR
jgi:hypothetical protein